MRRRKFFVSLQTDVASGSLIEVLGNVDNRNQVQCETLLTFENEQTANFGKKTKRNETKRKTFECFVVRLDMEMYNQAVMLFQHYPQDYLVNL